MKLALGHKTLLQNSQQHKHTAEVLAEICGKVLISIRKYSSVVGGLATSSLNV